MRPAQKLEPLLITLEPGGRSGKHPYPHPREEFGFVVEGRVSLTLGPETHLLAAGDAGDQAGRWERLFLFSRADTIYGGSNEIQRGIVAERVLGLPRQRRP